MPTQHGLLLSLLPEGYELCVPRPQAADLMLEPPPPESIASMWPVLVSAAEDGVRQAMYESAEEERIRREGLRIRDVVYDYFRQMSMHQQFGSTVEEYERMRSDMADADPGDKTPLPSTEEVQAAVDSLVKDGYMLGLPRNVTGDGGPQYFRTSGAPGPA